MKHLRSVIFRSLHRYSGAFKSALGCGTQRQTVTCSEDIPELPSLHTLVHDCAQKESQVREGGVFIKDFSVFGCIYSFFGFQLLKLAGLSSEQGRALVVQSQCAAENTQNYIKQTSFISLS